MGTSPDPRRFLSIPRAPGPWWGQSSPRSSLLFGPLGPGHTQPGFLAALSSPRASGTQLSICVLGVSHHSRHANDPNHAA